MTSWDLKGRTALITGGTRGIGAATVAEFTELGADVLYTARTSDGDPRCIVADVTVPEQRAEVLQR